MLEFRLMLSANVERNSSGLLTQPRSSKAMNRQQTQVSQCKYEASQELSFLVPGEDHTSLLPIAIRKALYRATQKSTIGRRLTKDVEASLRTGTTPSHRYSKGWRKKQNDQHMNCHLVKEAKFCH